MIVYARTDRTGQVRKTAKPLPILSVDDMKKQMRHCNIGNLPAATPSGTVIRLKVSVDESGKVTVLGATKTCAKLEHLPPQTAVAFRAVMQRLY